MSSLDIPNKFLDEFLEECASRYVKEATGHLVFYSNRLRNDHLVKHVLDSFREKWGELLGTDLVHQSRKERNSENFESEQVKKDERYFDKWSNCKSLAEKYEQCISNTLNNLCKKGEGHYHVVGYKNNSEHGYRASSVKIRAWMSSERMLIFAVANVRKGKVDRYRLLSSYRSVKDETEASFHSNQVEKRRIEKRITKKLKNEKQEIIATHI